MCEPFNYKEAQPEKTTNTLSTQDPIKDLMRVVERDVIIFPKLKDEKQWNDCYNKNIAQARSQFMDEIFGLNYVPGSIDEANLFDLKKRNMYAMQSSHLLFSLTKVNP